VRAARHDRFRLRADARPGSSHPYAGSYSDADLTWWADRIREWDLTGRDVLVYFNNDGSANAVRNARALQALLMSHSVSYAATSLASSS
jgi:uncharacterized protein YecE (DUF72 family)